jgi:tetratricopeptide (TPR) repeat protein
MRVAGLTAGVTALAVGLFLIGGALVGGPPSSPTLSASPGTTVSASAVRGGGHGSAARTVQARVAATQALLRERPGDRAGWGRLGAAYVEQARITGDPAYYGRAAEAFGRAAGHPAALTGLGALANARHRFAEARTWAERALAADARDPAAHGVLVDALTQLGRYEAATAAAQRMLDLRPDVASYTRASYELELHGDVAGAREALGRALSVAATPADVAFCRQYLGQLALTTGNAPEALRQYARGLAADPGSAALLAGRARALAATGEVAAALRDYAAATARLPAPQYLLEYAELAQAAGRTGEAGRQHALVRTQQRLLAAAGAGDDLFSALYEADHGSPARALRHARAEWAERQSVEVADALAWALHRAGQDAEALRFARSAARLGWRNALFAYHRGMIERSLGQREAARRSLAAALRTDPAFSPLHAPAARKALAALGGAP